MQSESIVKRIIKLGFSFSTLVVAIAESVGTLMDKSSDNRSIFNFDEISTVTVWSELLNDHNSPDRHKLYKSSSGKESQNHGNHGHGLHRSPLQSQEKSKAATLTLQTLRRSLTNHPIPRVASTGDRLVNVSLTAEAVPLSP